jgi:hypothetical protein
MRLDASWAGWVLGCLWAAACSGGTGAPTLAQHEITQAGALLDGEGRLREPGWSRRQLLDWNASAVHDPARLRQWDFFTVENQAVAVNLTLTDLGFAQLGSVGVVELATGATHQSSLFKSFGDQLTLSAAVEGSASLTPAGAASPAISFATSSDTSTLTIDIPASLLGAAASGRFTIHRRPAMQYLSLATPFSQDPHFFFYEQKIPGQTADGTLTVGAQSWSFAADSAVAVMDWGRGEWPSSATLALGGRLRHRRRDRCRLQPRRRVRRRPRRHREPGRRRRRGEQAGTRRLVARRPRPDQGLDLHRARRARVAGPASAWAGVGRPRSGNALRASA